MTEFTDKEGNQRVQYESYYCRMNFCDWLRYDPSGEGNITLGRERVIDGHLDFDGRGQVKFNGKRNHPQILQEPHAFHYYGANNDIQRFLIPTAEDNAILSNIELYENKLFNLFAVGMIGLDKFCGGALSVHYTTKYFTKGIASSENWNSSCKSLVTAFCDSGNVNTKSGTNHIPANHSVSNSTVCNDNDQSLPSPSNKSNTVSDSTVPTNTSSNTTTPNNHLLPKPSYKTLRGAVSTSMLGVTKSMAVPRDYATYICSGGKLTRSTWGIPKVTSLNEIPIEEIKPADNEEELVDHIMNDTIRDKK